jgi:ATP-binding cassette subfamily B protein
MGRTVRGTPHNSAVHTIMVAGGVAALTEIWSELQRAAGATERLVELLTTTDAVTDPVQAPAVPR